MLYIDDTSKGVVKRLQESIDYSTTFTTIELAHYLAEIVMAWYQHRMVTFYPFPYTDACDALDHAKEVLDAVH